jgi:hypothetical protein
MSSESVCQVARSWVDVGSFHTRLVARFMIFTASIRNVLDWPIYCLPSSILVLKLGASQNITTTNICIPSASRDAFWTGVLQRYGTWLISLVQRRTVFRCRFSIIRLWYIIWYVMIWYIIYDIICFDMIYDMIRYDMIYDVICDMI